LPKENPQVNEHRAWYDAAVKTRFLSALLATTAGLLLGCGSAPPSHPPLSPQIAQQLLRYNTRAANHLKFVQHEDPSCSYVLQLPDQGPHQSSIELSHIVSCNGRTDIKAFDARVEYEWNKSKGSWEITYFGS
jgi:hypothetical protein